MYTSSSSAADKYGTGRTAAVSKYHHHHGNSSSSSSPSYGVLTELSPDRRSRAYNSVPRQVLSSSSVRSSPRGLTDINGNIRSLSLNKTLSSTSSTTLGSRGDVTSSIGSKTNITGSAALLLGNEKRYDATKKRMDAFYNNRSPSSLLLNKSYNYRAGNLSYFEKYNKHQQTPRDTPPCSETVHQPQSRYVNMNKSKYGTDNSGGTLLDSSYRSSSDSKKGVVGIRNIGNTCYMNSVLQCLSNTKSLTDYVLADPDGVDGKLIRVYRDLLSRIWTGNDNHPVDTTAFKSAFQRLSPRFAGYDQQDSQEFLRLLLDKLHMDVNRVKIKPRTAPDVDETLKDNALAADFWQRYLATDNSTVVDLFAGQLKSTLECSVCGHKSITFEVGAPYT